MLLPYSRLPHTLLLLCLSLLPTPPAHAQDETSPVMHVFVREGCAHCTAQKAFMTDWLAEEPNLRIEEHDLANADSHALFDALTEKAKLPKATPLTFMAGTVIQGFATAETTGVRLKTMFENNRKKTDVSPQAFVEGNVPTEVAHQDTGCDETGATPCAIPGDEYLVHIPFFGTANLETLSLPAIAAILGFVDGFNPCAMWVLITFLLVLLQLEDRKKVWQVAGLFIAAETIMYYLILNVWFTAWDFIGLDQYVTPIVGLIAMGAGCFFLYEATCSKGECKITSLEQRRRTNLRIKNIATMPFTLASAIAVIGLALSVNIIEFACSVGIPQTFTKILDLNNLSFLHRQAMMFTYIFMYMIDDFIVFGLALWSTEYVHLTHKYSRLCNVIGGALMILLGALLVFAPGVLQFAQS